MMIKPQFDARIVSMVSNSNVLLKSSSSPGWKRLNVHYVPVPPLSYRSTRMSSLRGNDVEIWDTMAKYLNVDVKYVPEWSFNALTKNVCTVFKHDMCKQKVNQLSKVQGWYTIHSW